MASAGRPRHPEAEQAPRSDREALLEHDDPCEVDVEQAIQERDEERLRLEEEIERHGRVRELDVDLAIGKGRRDLTCGDAREREDRDREEPDHDGTQRHPAHAAVCAEALDRSCNSRQYPTTVPPVARNVRGRNHATRGAKPCRSSVTFGLLVTTLRGWPTKPSSGPWSSAITRSSSARR